ncbi:hypothetical protein [Vibrio splendidus]|uniref:Uncharacterized protein n=1 Tax=Vibrio splendidus TaxID=29497 RepID=A0A837NPV5_VIBSP|nr:hypothetical protein [Vibrio splendidus]KPL93362.1 hypothetical protein AN168_15450 [Vibrio splendidus]
MIDEKRIEEFLKKHPEIDESNEGANVEVLNGELHLVSKFNLSDVEELGEESMFYLPFCSITEVKRILSPQNPQDLLLSIQANAIADNVRVARTFAKRRGSSSKWNLEKYYNELVYSTYTSYLSKGNKSKVDQVPLSYAYITEVNAYCSPTEKGNLIVISEPLKQFLYFMNISAWGNGMFNIPQEDCFSAYIIAMRIAQGHESYDFDLDPRANLPEAVELYFNGLVSLQMEFIIGHEYAHHILGHVKHNKLKRLNWKGENSKIGISNFYKHSHKEEYDADWHAIKHIKNSKRFREQVANAAFEVLMYFDSLERINNYLDPGRERRPSTHPKPMDRINKLRRRLHNGLGHSRTELDLGLNAQRKFTDKFINEYLCFNFDAFETKGAHYLSTYKKKLLIDRVDY